MSIQKLVEAFAVNAGASYITKPFPVASQIPTDPGSASLNDGFTPLNMTPVTMGGIPPSGADMNGILYQISSILAAINQGLVAFVYDATFQTAIGGYPHGAMLQQAANPLAFWISTVAANATDPDTGGAGWLSTVPLYSSAALSGPNNVVLPGVSDYVIDVSTSGGNVNYTGFVAQRDGQRLKLRNTGANLLTVNAMNAGSSAANRVSAVADVSTEQYGSIGLQYSTGAGLWIFG